MSDRELIINFLEKAERRARSNKRFNDIALVLAIAFVVPVVFKLLDFFVLFRGRTLIAFLVFWAIATVVTIVIRFRGKGSLSYVAGQIDSKAQLHDQLKTAYWFAQNPRQSDWVDAQLRHSVKTTEKLQLSSLFPLRFPRASYLVGGLIFLLVALNFLPLSLNYNWIYLQAAPPFRLTDVERASLDRALKLLEKAKGAENAAVAQQIQEVISELEQGQISEAEANKRLAEIQEQLEAGDLDAENVGNGIAQMAAILRQAKPFQPAAQEMGKGQLAEAANQMQALNERLDTVPSADIREMADRLLQASERPRSGLQDLAKSFEMTGAALQRGDRAGGHSGIDRIARELQDLAQQLEDQKLRSEAADELGDLVDALDGDPQISSDATSQSSKSSSQNKGQPGEQGKGESSEPGEAQSGQSPDQAGEGQPGEGGEQGQEGQPGENPGGQSDDNPNGKGGNSFGGSTKSAPLEGEATSLEVQLEKEALKVDENAPGSSEANKDVEAAGERERSKLDYRNAPSDLTPAQKDLLSQDHIPWERRQLIKNYFQAVKPTQTK